MNWESSTQTKQQVSEEPRQNKERGLVDRKQFEASSNFIAGRPKAALLFFFFFFVILDVVCYYLLLFLLYMNIEIGKKDAIC